MLRIQNDAPGPEQLLASQTIHTESALYNRGDTVTARWVPGHRGVTGYQTADLYAQWATEEPQAGRVDGKDRKGIVCMESLKRRRTERIVE